MSSEKTVKTPKEKVAAPVAKTTTKKQVAATSTSVDKKAKSTPKPKASSSSTPSVEKKVKKEAAVIPKKEVQKLVEKKLEASQVEKKARKVTKGGSATVAVKKDITDVPTSSIQKRHQSTGRELASKRAIRNRKYQQIMKSQGLLIPFAIFRRDFRDVVKKVDSDIKTRPPALWLLQYNVEQNMKELLATAVLLCYQAKRVTIEEEDIRTAALIHAF